MGKIRHMEIAKDKSNKRKIDFSAFANVVVFFTLEVLAFIAFSLGSSYILFSVLTFVLLVFLILVTFRQIKTDGLASFGFFLFPIFVFGVLSALSVFTKDPMFSLGGNAFFIPIGMTCFAACGYLVASLKSFSISKALLVIYSALAILTLINLIATMVEFTPFYTLIYRNKFIYYDGDISDVPISEMAFALLGFSISEVSVEYFSLFPSLLLTAFIPLFFLKFKQNKTVFMLYLGYSVLGLFSLLTTVSKTTLVSDVLVFVIVLLVLLFSKLNWKGKVLKIVSIVFGSLFLLGLVVLFLNAQEGASGIFATLQNFISGNQILNKLFNVNRFADSYNKILNALLTTNSTGDFVYLFGFYPTYNVPVSNSWLFDNLMTSGIFGFLFFAVFLVLGVRHMLIYYRNSDDNIKDKAMIVAFIFCFFFYGIINFDMTPLIFSKTLSPIYLSGPFLVTLFLFSYTAFKTINVVPVVETIQPLIEENKAIESKKGDVDNETISL